MHLSIAGGRELRNLIIGGVLVASTDYWNTCGIVIVMSNNLHLGRIFIVRAVIVDD